MNDINDITKDDIFYIGFCDKNNKKELENSLINEY